MPLTLVDMSMVKGAQKLNTLSAGTQALITNIINESNTSNIASAGGTGNKEKFFNHGYDMDPASQGRIRTGPGIDVHIYYMPSNKTEYDGYEVIDKAVGMLSGRRRLVVRKENGKVIFYTTSHPREAPGLRSNSYTVFTPIDASAAVVAV